MRRVLSILIVFITTQSFSQSIDWEKDFGWDVVDEFNSITKSGKNYYAVGKTTRSYKTWASLIKPAISKFDSLGDTLWFKDYDTSIVSGQQLEMAYSAFDKILYGGPNNLIVCGSWSDFVENHLFCMSVDTNGVIQWINFPDFTPFTNGKGFADFELLPNGDIIMVGGMIPNTFLMARVSSTGSLMWKQSHYHPSYESIWDITTFSDGSVYACGSVTDSMFLLKFDPVNGAILAEHTAVVPGDTNKRQWAWYMNEDMNHEIVIAGMTSTYSNANQKGYFIRVDTNFNVLYNKLLGNKYAYFAYQTDDSNYVTVYPNITFDDCRVEKMDGFGNQKWSIDLSGRAAAFVSDEEGGLMGVGWKDYGGAIREQFYITHLTGVGNPAQIPCLNPPVIDTMYAIAGPGQFQFQDSVRGGLKYNSELYHQWYFQDGQTADSADPLIFFDNVAYPDSFWAVLIVFDGAGCSDTMSINAYTNEEIDFPLDDPVISGIKEEQEGSIGITAYPNPFTHDITFEIRTSQTEKGTIQILSVTGQEVYNQAFTSNAPFTILEDFDNGLYFAQILIGDQLKVVKVVKQ